MTTHCQHCGQAKWLSRVFTASENERETYRFALEEIEKESGTPYSAMAKEALDKFRGEPLDNEIVEDIW